MTQLQRSILVVSLIILSVLLLFIPFKQKEPVSLEKESTPIAILSMTRLNLPPNNTTRESKNETTEPNSTPEEIATKQSSSPTLRQEETSMSEEAEIQKEKPLTSKNTKGNLPEKLTVETNYYTINTVTIRPQFNRSLLASKIVYPNLAKRQGKEGTVVLRLFIDVKGNIERIVVEEDPGYGFAEAAIKAFSNIQTTPAVLGSKPVPVTLLYPIRFTLQDT